LTRSAKWRVPNDFLAARRAQNTGTPIAFEKNNLARTFVEMANAACGRAASLEKKKKFGLF
jgi:hypothetical protein